MNIGYEIKRQKTIEQKLGYKFIRIDREDFDILKLSMKYLGTSKNYPIN